ncbi:hypothetical protein Tco_1365158 [Tanacetum coccineum]
MCEKALDVILMLLRVWNVLDEDLEEDVLMLRDKEQMVKKLRKCLLWDGSKKMLAYIASSSTPFKTRHKRKVADGKNIHKDVNIKPKDVVRKKQKCLYKGKEKVNEDEKLLRHTNKVVVSNYRRVFDNGKAIMIEDVGVVNE